MSETESDGGGETERETPAQGGGSAPPEGEAAAPEGPANEPDPPPDPLALLSAERDRLKDQLLRTAADYDNFRKRSRRDLEDAERRGREDALKEMLPVIDNLERAVAAASTATDVASVADGVRMVLKQFEDAAQRLGLERIPAVGERFDPAIHDAVQQVETAEHAPGTIVGEIVPGYRLSGKLVRAALVVVARPPAATGDGG